MSSSSSTGSQKKYITADLTIDPVRNPEDGALLHADIHHTPSASKQLKPLEELRTKNHKLRSAEQENDLLSKNPSPSWLQLRRFIACRLLDPNARDTIYWCMKDIPFNTGWVEKMQQCMMVDENDIYLWAYKPVDKEDKQPLRLHEPSHTVPADFILVDESTGSEVKVQALVVQSSNGTPAYTSSRRTGFLIIRDLHSV
jgi:hypothetical protein